MKILLNASTLVVGGGLQVAQSFIEHTVNKSNCEFLYVVTQVVFDRLDSNIQGAPNIFVVERSPAHPIYGRKSKKKIIAVANDFRPDLVYSIGFPSYINFKGAEIGRYTNPWEISTDPLPWHVYREVTSKVLIWLGIRYRRYWARKSSYIETQTEQAKVGICRNLKFPKNKVYVVPNSANQLFSIDQARLLATEKEGNLVFCLAADYPHKNLMSIPEVARILSIDHGIDARFIVTLPEDSPTWVEIQNRLVEYDLRQSVQNVGVLTLNECFEYYLRSKAVFLPTLLEIFSATYLEAMSMGVPIVTTDKDFSRDNCGEAACFFAEGDYSLAASHIARLINEVDYFDEMRRRGFSRLKEFPTLDAKYQLIFRMFDSVIAETGLS